MKEALQLLLELMGWGIAGLRSVVSDTVSERKAKKRSDTREADMLQRFAWPRCACTHEQREHVQVGGEWPCRVCGCVHFRASVRP